MTNDWRDKKIGTEEKSKKEEKKVKMKKGNGERKKKKKRDKWKKGTVTLEVGIWWMKWMRDNTR